MGNASSLFATIASLILGAAFIIFLIRHLGA